MSLEIRYIAMIDEGDHGYPKIMRVIYNEEGEVVASSESSLAEAKNADPSSIERYFDCLRDYFRSIADFIDTQTDTTSEVGKRMMELMVFCSRYVSADTAEQLSR